MENHFELHAGEIFPKDVQGKGRWLNDKSKSKNLRKNVTFLFQQFDLSSTFNIQNFINKRNFWPSFVE